MIKKVLIANRGEIAVRIMRTCREMGIRTVAVYSDVDKNALHAETADESVSLGGVTAAESYLDQNKIIAAAKKSGADAIHPGYGFLSENAAFAGLVAKGNLIWIGPPSSAIRKMGSKTDARSLMQAAGVPIVQGTNTIEDLLNVEAFADRVGYPVLLKASAGGGGKGMKIVASKYELESALASARREAKSAFGDDSVYAEKYLVQPRHIEIQVFADSFGNVVYLGERECTLQRRHQKIIEEAPSSSVTPELRKQMGETAVKAAKACGYVNAGTIEFLLDASGNFYFLEMNTRLQVEHPITEEVTGLDLVRLQLEIASGEKLRLDQSGIHPRGHAIEVRIYAEDVVAGFLPATGTITHLKSPAGPGVREDSGMRAGNEISRHYDPMISKLIVRAESRETAIARMIRALDEYEITGVRTTIPFCRHILQSKTFKHAAFDTGSVERFFLPDYLSESDKKLNDESLLAAALATAMDKLKISASPQNGHRPASRWKLTGRTAVLNGSDQ